MYNLGFFCASGVSVARVTGSMSVLRLVCFAFSSLIFIRSEVAYNEPAPNTRGKEHRATGQGW